MQIGKINTLDVIDEFPFGYYLQAPGGDKVMLPSTSVQGEVKTGDRLDVFVYHDSDDRLVCSMKKPLAMVNEVAFLKVKSIADFGAFLDWGLDKDLLVHNKAQDNPMSVGLGYAVYVYQDPESGRLAATSRLRDFLSEQGQGFKPKQAVDLLIYARTDMGYKAVINGTHLGLIFKDEVFQSLSIGDTLPGFIKRVREDGKIDLCFQFHDQAARKDLTEQILDDLEAHGGISTLTDKSSAQEINQRFGVSKGAYKKAIGALYKQKRILLDKTKITLIK